MKNLLIGALCSLLFISCQKEFSFEGPDTNNPTSPSNPTNPTNPANTACFECDYNPVCDSTKMVYQDDMMGSVNEVTFIYDLLADSTINGNSWKKVKELNSGQITFLRCANNVIQGYFPSATGQSGTTYLGILQTPLKSNEPAGATWTDIINNAGSEIRYKYKIIEKNITRQVLDSTYNNVIYVRDTTYIVAPMVGEMATNVRHCWFAKGIGQVEVKMEDLMSGMEIYTRKLKSYKIR